MDNKIGGGAFHRSNTVWQRLTLYWNCNFQPVSAVGFYLKTIQNFLPIKRVYYDCYMVRYLKICSAPQFYVFHFYYIISKTLKFSLSAPVSESEMCFLATVLSEILSAGLVYGFCRMPCGSIVSIYIVKYSWEFYIFITGSTRIQCTDFRIVIKKFI